MASRPLCGASSPPCTQNERRVHTAVGPPPGCGWAMFRCAMLLRARSPAAQEPETPAAAGPAETNMSGLKSCRSCYDGTSPMRACPHRVPHDRPASVIASAESPAGSREAEPADPGPSEPGKPSRAGRPETLGPSYSRQSF